MKRANFEHHNCSKNRFVSVILYFKVLDFLSPLFFCFLSQSLFFLLPNFEMTDVSTLEKNEDAQNVQDHMDESIYPTSSATNKGFLQ